LRRSNNRAGVFRGTDLSIADELFASSVKVGDQIELWRVDDALRKQAGPAKLYAATAVDPKELGYGC
jgi:hypothetical protein